MINGILKPLARSKIPRRGYFILILFKKAKCLFIAPKARSGSHETV